MENAAVDNKKRDQRKDHNRGKGYHGYHKNKDKDEDHNKVKGSHGSHKNKDKDRRDRERVSISFLCHPICESEQPLQYTVH